MRRTMLLLVAVWLVMAAMMVVLAVPVLAANTGDQKGQGNQGPPAISGFGNPNTASNVRHNQFGTNGACVAHRGSTLPEDETGGGCTQ
jgi:hypothetical protein